MSTKRATTTRSKTTSSKPKTAAKRRPKKLVAPEPKKEMPVGDSPAPTLVSEAPVVSTTPALRKKELISTIVERSGVRKKFTKPVVEAMLTVLGDAISEGRDMNLQPMGRIKQQRAKDIANARVVVAKIRQNKPVDAVTDDRKTAVATAAE